MNLVPNVPSMCRTNGSEGENEKEKKEERRKIIKGQMKNVKYSENEEEEKKEEDEDARGEGNDCGDLDLG